MMSRMERLLVAPIISGAIVGGALEVANALKPELDTTCRSVYNDTALGHMWRATETGTSVAFSGGMGAVGGVCAVVTSPLWVSALALGSMRGVVRSQQSNINVDSVDK
jgi:hypothetical protein